MTTDLDLITRRLKGVGTIRFVRDNQGNKHFLATAPDGISVAFEFHYMKDQALSDARRWLKNQGVGEIEELFSYPHV
jgi:hypothetical protein